jgi:hypothetical protein
VRTHAVSDDSLDRDAIGSRIVKLAPSPSMLSTEIVPPWASTI